MTSPTPIDDTGAYFPEYGDDIEFVQVVDSSGATVTENEVADSLDVMFIGTVTTSSSSIVDVSIKKTTRINLYHISDYENIKGSSIPTF